jgi:mannose-6-phosphate isomerase-like protein (cupin superfamily)
VALSVINLARLADEIAQPFMVRPVARLGPLLLSVFICQGQVDWHKHLDEDELFLVHEGVIELETDRGSLSLHAEEMAVVPKGTLHRSRSALRSTVVLIRPAVLTERKNGQRRFYTTDDDAPLEKVRLARVIEASAEPFRLVTLARVEDFNVLLAEGREAGPIETAPVQGAVWLVVRGALRVDAETGDTANANAGELAVIPGQTPYRLTALQPSLLMTLTRRSGAEE